MSDAPYVAASPAMVTFSGKEYTIHPLCLKDWGALENMAIAAYKRELIETVTANLDVLPEDYRDKALADVLAKASEVNPENMPKRMSTVIGEGDKKIEVDYSMWWMQGTFEGRLTILWLSMRQGQGQEDLTRDDISRVAGPSGLTVVLEAITAAIELSTTKVGNSEGPPVAETAPLAG